MGLGQRDCSERIEVTDPLVDDEVIDIQGHTMTYDAVCERETRDKSPNIMRQKRMQCR